MIRRCDYCDVGFFFLHIYYGTYTVYIVLFLFHILLQISD